MPIFRKVAHNIKRQQDLAKRIRSLRDQLSLAEMEMQDEINNDRRQRATKERLGRNKIPNRPFKKPSQSKRKGKRKSKKNN